ncbi:hypothetical protein GCM10017643_38570 [Ancylobacter dichloromethanicus]|uniref:Uncharacterized protein n=1 Tax=Ancylobacter dichloromethanicus TaxID=518825 RepID=A0A9W6JCZ6_9HYPH|nr:hypothetical protein GCM10017643_38570 [Ancylobacter dichloromethanicus]
MPAGGVEDWPQDSFIALGHDGRDHLIEIQINEALWLVGAVRLQRLKAGRIQDAGEG